MNFPFSSARRKLLVFAAGFTSTLGGALAAFGQTANTSAKQATKPRTDGFQPVVGPTTILDQNGKVLTDKVLIVRNKANNKLVAVSPFCPHRNCAVDWKQDKQSFYCPCHGSEFGTDGKVIKGPADKGLKSFEVKTEGNRFLIKPLP